MPLPTGFVVVGVAVVDVVVRGTASSVPTQT